MSPATLPQIIAKARLQRRREFQATRVGQAYFLMGAMPLAATSWYASLALTTPLLIGALAAWALYVILSARAGMASRPASAV